VSLSGLAAMDYPYFMHFRSDRNMKDNTPEGFNACQRRQRLFVALSRAFYRMDVCGVSRGNNRGSLIVIL